jgi:hypothetical protein
VLFRSDRPAIGPAIPLTAAPAAPAATGGDLARPAAAPARGDAAQALARHVFVEGGAPPARPNRADDASWPRP